MAAQENGSNNGHDAVVGDVLTELRNTMTVGYIHEAYKEWCIKNADYLLELEHKGGEVSTKDIMSVVGDKMSDHFEEYFCEHGGQSGGEQKSENAAKELRDAGNKLYQAKKFSQAIAKYTRSAQFAPPTSEALSLAFANRSAVLFQMKEYSKCLEDIESSLEAGYPKTARYKLLERKVKCLVNLGNVTGLENQINEFVTALKDADLGEEKEKKIGMELKSLMDKASASAAKSQVAPNKAKETSKGKTDVSSSPLSLPKISSPNPNFSTLSKAVDIRFDQEIGRHGVATRRIRAGELLLVEDPPLSVLAEDVQGRLCSLCFQGAQTMFPSPLNTKDVFCSQICLDAALSSDQHRIESSMSGLLSSCGLVKKEWLLALRAITKKPLSWFRENKDKIFSKHDTLYGTRGEVFRTQDGYRETFNLVTNPDSWNTPTNVFKCFVLKFLLRCLTHAGYFEGSAAPEEDKSYIVSLLLHFMEVCTMNCHEIGHVRATDSGTPWHAAPLYSIGCALEPTVGLLNNSCDPNTCRINVGRATLIYAARDIGEDEEVTDSYLPLGQATPRDERRSDLQKKYGFLCQCRPCSEKWPLQNEMPKGLGDVPPEQFRFPLDDIKRMQAQFSCIQKLGGKINAEQKMCNYTEVFALTVEFLKVLDDTMDRPHQFFIMTQKTMSSTLWSLVGSKERWTEED